MTKNTTAFSADSLLSATPTALYRDLPLPANGMASQPAFHPRVARLTLPGGDVVEQTLFATFALLTLPMIAYCSTQLWKLLSSGSLDHAVRAFMP